MKDDNTILKIHVGYVLVILVLMMFSSVVYGQDDSGTTTTVNTNNSTESTSTNTNTNSNTNTNTNNNTNTSTSTSTSESTVSSTVNSDNNNYNENVSTSESESYNENYNQNINTNNNNSTTNSNSESRQWVYSPPSSAIAPSIGSSYSQDLCTTGVSGAVQTQIIGVSSGKSVTDENCERIKLSKTLFDMGMKVASVSLMCQDERVFTAMEMAGTPCPYNGLIGTQAQQAWEDNPERRPDYENYMERQRQAFMEDCMLEESERQCLRNWSDLQG